MPLSCVRVKPNCIVVPKDPVEPVVNVVCDRGGDRHVVCEALDDSVHASNSSTSELIRFTTRSPSQDGAARGLPQQ